MDVASPDWQVAMFASISWNLLMPGAAIASVGLVGLWLAAQRFRGGGGSSLSPIVALGAALVVLAGLGVMFVSLNLWGTLGR